MRSKLLLTAAGGVVAAAITAGVFVSSVGAQQPSPTPPPSARQQQAQQRANDFIDRLARNLGVTPERLRDALRQTAIQGVDQALAEGRITQQQADRLKEQINAGAVMPFGPGFGFGRPGPFGEGRLGIPGFDKAALAQFLGITPEQLRQELPGKSLAQVAAAHGKTADQLKQFIISNAQQRLAQAVSAGRMTQQQADAALQALQNRVDEIINRIHGQGMGPRRGR